MSIGARWRHWIENRVRLAWTVPNCSRAGPGRIDATCEIHF